MRNFLNLVLGLIMRPVLMLTFSTITVSYLAVVLLGAPFYPPSRPRALDLVVVLNILGTIFIICVTIAALLIYKGYIIPPVPTTIIVRDEENYYVLEEVDESEDEFEDEFEDESEEEYEDEYEDESEDVYDDVYEDEFEDDDEYE